MVDLKKLDKFELCNLFFDPYYQNILAQLRFRDLAALKNINTKML
jgi:hypothetical protein